MTPKNNIVIAIPEGKIRDYVDETIRQDTPEEYVRQTVEKRLVNEHKYPKNRIKIEYSVQMGAGKKRADIVGVTGFQNSIAFCQRDKEHEEQLVDTTSFASALPSC